MISKQVLQVRLNVTELRHMTEKNRIVISVFIVQTLKYRVSVNEEERDLHKIMNYRFELYLYFVITP